MNSSKTIVTPQTLREQIHVFRGHKVMLDNTLAALYGVETRRLNEQVRRNRARFPVDFLFELSSAEFTHLKSQSATSSWGGRRKPPFAFTEHGAIMAAAVLNSQRAIEMSVYVVRAFVQLRELASSHKELARRLDELEQRVAQKFATHDQAITDIIDAIRELMTPPPAPAKQPIGFVHEEMTNTQREENG